MYKRHFVSLGILVEKELLVCVVNCVMSSPLSEPSSQVHTINTLSFSLDFLLQPGTTSNLPPYLLPVAPEPPIPPIHKAESIMSSAELEDVVLSIDGRVSMEFRAKLERTVPPSRVDFTRAVSSNTSPSNQAAKSLSIWRWHEDRVPELEVQQMLLKGGREYNGTVYYLRHA